MLLESKLMSSYPINIGYICCVGYFSDDANSLNNNKATETNEKRNGYIDMPLFY